MQRLIPSSIMERRRKKMRKCKITVLKTHVFQDLADEFVKDPNYTSCPIFKEGQTFVTGGIFGNEMPEDFGCAMAWPSLEMPVNVLVGGGKVFGFSERHITCCNDGVRPVVFLLEAIEDDE